MELLSKIRHYVPKHLIRTIYFSIFNSHLIYACEIWDQNQNSQHFENLLKLQEKAPQIINFQPPTATTNHLILENKILKIVDFIKHRYALFVRSSLRKEGVLLFNDMFTMSHSHNHITQGSVIIFSIYHKEKPFTLEITLLDQLPPKFGTIFTGFRIVIF